MVTSATPPDDFDDHGKRLWRTYLKKMKDEGLWSVEQAPLLEMLVRNLLEAEHCRISGTEPRPEETSDGETIMVDGRWVPGSRYNQTINARLKRQRECEQDAQKILYYLGITAYQNEMRKQKVDAEQARAALAEAERLAEIEKRKPKRMNSGLRSVI